MSQSPPKSPKKPPTKGGKPRQRRRKGEAREKPTSLAPLAFEDALAGLLAVKPKKSREDEANA